MPQLGTAAPPAAHRRIPDQWRSGCRQSALVLGATQLGGYGAAGGPPVGQVADLLGAAVALGVTHVDTARAFGTGERRLGAALPGHALEMVSRVAAPTDQGADAARLGSAVEDSVAGSLRDLGVSRLTPLLPGVGVALAAGGAAWAALRRLRAEGVATRIGVVVRRPADLPVALDLPDLDYLQLPCNILDWRWLAPEVTAALCRRPDLVVTVRSAFLQGLLAAGRSVRWPGLPDPQRDALVDALDAVAAELGRSRDELCLAYVRALPWVTSVVVAAESADQLRQHATLTAGPPLTTGEREWVRSALPAVPEELLDPTRWRTVPAPNRSAAV
ncbi:MAG TPA: aldo/keto reductase [Pilimelia sp.]|nr:aldo/keto reductase [Pilimelia sp.]